MRGEPLVRITPPGIGQGQRPTGQQAGLIGYTWASGSGGCLSRWPCMDINDVHNKKLLKKQKRGKRRMQMAAPLRFREPPFLRWYCAETCKP